MRSGAEAPARPTADGCERRPRLRSAAPRLVLGIALSALSGALAVVALPPYSVEWLMWVAWVPMVVAQHRVMPQRVSGLALGAGIGVFWAGFLGPGIAAPEGNVPWFLYLYPLFVAILVAAIARGSRAFHTRTAYRWFPIATPVAWVAIDWLRTQHDAFAGTVGYPAYAMFEHPALIQPVAVFGVHALNLLILAVNWAIAGLGIAWVDRRRGTDGATMHWRRAIVGASVTGLLVVAWAALSLALLRAPAGPSVRVAAVQPAVSRIVPAERRPANSELVSWERNVEATRAAARRGARLVVWHEGALRADPRTHRTAELRALARETRAYLAIGWSGDGRDDVAVIAPDGRFLGSYGKNHPAELIGERSSNQDSYPRFTAPFGRFGAVICYDFDFTDAAREWARRGARIVAAPSGDFAGHFATWHYTHLVFRAIENRFAAVKADIAFDSAIIDPFGRIIRKAVHPDGARATIVADVPLGTARSPQVRLGDWVAQLCVAAAAVFLVASARSRRRVRRQR